MPDAEAAIAQLDRMLLRCGSSVVLSRGSASVTAMAVLTGFKPEELVSDSGVLQGDKKFVLSPTEINSGTWPAAQTTGEIDTRIPRKGDRIVQEGSTFSVQYASGRYISGALVRIDGVARGL